MEDTRLLDDPGGGELRAAEEADRSRGDKLRRIWNWATPLEPPSGETPPRELVLEAIREGCEELAGDGGSREELEELLEQAWPADYSFKRGDRAWARCWMEWGGFLPAVVDQVLEGGTCLVNWEDGDDRRREQYPGSMIPSSVVTMRDHFEAKAAAWGAMTQIHPALLPRWSFSVDGVSTSTRSVIGPVVPWLRATSAVNFLTQAGTLALVLAYMARTRQSAYPPQVWALLLPGLALKAYTEMRSLRLFIVPYVLDMGNAGLAEFKIVCLTVGFRAWLVYATTCSLLLAIDIMSDSLFVASVLAHPDRATLAKLWAASFRTTTLRRLHVPCPPHRTSTHIRRSVWIVRVGCLAMVLSLALTACKLCAAYLCESSMWNLSEVFSESRGCLDASELLARIS